MKKLFAILLAFIFLATNLPFAITTHFCSGQAVNSALVLKGNTVDCGRYFNLVSMLSYLRHF